MTDSEKKSLTLRISPETHKKLRVLSALAEKTMTRVIEDLVEDAYQEAIKKEIHDK